MASNYHRVNIDGQSLYKTETRVMAAALLPGTFVVIDANNKFAQATELRGRMYVLDCAYTQGLGIRDAVPADDSGIGNYVEQAREFAILCPAGTYKKDDPIKLGTAGMGAKAADDTDSVIGYSQDDAVIAAGQTDFIRVRFRVGTVAP
ncbi:MAG: capsid stabilizing protein [Caudoviricetes sp.]|nr:MAG: capsid stabilizing protein [Caudoviricetes sp.]